MSIFEEYDPYFNSELELALEEASKIKNTNFLVLFEADQPVAANTMQQNQQQKQGVVSHLSNALEALRKMITSLMTRISDWFQKLTMGNKEKQLYDRVVEACKKDPQLAGKQISVTDFRAARKEYLNIMRQIELAEQQGNQSAADRLIEQLKGGFGGALKGITVTVGMQAAMNIAQSNREMAAMISEQLKNDSRLVDTMEQAVGRKEANKFQKDVQRYTKECKLRRAILGIRGKLFSNVADAVTDVYDSVEQAVDFAQTPAGATKIVKGARVLGNKTTTDMARRLAGNKQIQAGAKTAIGMKKDQMVGKAKGKINNWKNRNYQIAEDRRRQNGNMTNASSAEFLAGGVNSATNKLNNFFKNLGQ